MRSEITYLFLVERCCFPCPVLGGLKYVCHRMFKKRLRGRQLDSASCVFCSCLSRTLCALNKILTSLSFPNTGANKYIKMSHSAVDIMSINKKQNKSVTSPPHRLISKVFRRFHTHTQKKKTSAIFEIVDIVYSHLLNRLQGNQSNHFHVMSIPQRSACFRCCHSTLLCL